MISVLTRFAHHRISHVHLSQTALIPPLRIVDSRLTHFPPSLTPAMALPEVLDILSTAAFDNPESIPNQNCALLRQLEIWRCDNDSYEIINEPLLINSLPLWLSQPVPESFESNKVVAGTKFLIVELAHETVYGLNGHSAIQSALEAFELPSALRSCYDFGGSYSHIQLPIRLGVDNHKCFYCRFPGQIGITWSKNGNTLLSRGVAVFWDHKCANLFVDYMMMHKAWVGMVLLPAYICSLVYLHDMIQNTRHIALEIQAVEGKTRFNRFSAGQKYVDIHPKTDDHVGLCTFTSGTIARLLFARHKAKEFHKILGAIKKGLRELVSAGGGLKPHSEWTRLQRTVDDIDELCESLIDQIDMHRSLGENQVNAIFNTMSYSQGRVTTVIARDIKGLSMGSGVDLIAMLSLFFLPGTFIAVRLPGPAFILNELTQYSHSHS